MAWPFSRWANYVAQSTPTIAAAFLNAIQDSVIGLFDGTKSVFGLTADGTGNNTVTPFAGGVRVTGLATETTAAGTDRGIGLLCAGNVDQGWARVDATGTLKRGFNHKSASRTGVGVYEVVFNWQPTNTTTQAPSVTVIEAGGSPCFANVEADVDGSGYSRLTVRVYQAGAVVVLADYPFVCGVKGE